METSPLAPLFETGSVIALVSKSKGGKTTLACEIIEQCDELFAEPPTRILIYARANKGQFDHLLEDKRVEVIERFPEDIENDRKEHALAFIDDATSGLTTKEIKRLELIATCTAHHSSVSVLVSLHNFFFPGLRTFRMSVDYTILFANCTDKMSILRTASQWYPGNKYKKFLRIYHDATSKPYGYLMFCATNNCPDKFRLRSDITKIPSVLYKL